MDTLPAPPWRTPRKTRPPRQSLSQDAIVAAALRILDRDGLDAISMRTVAQELGTGPASLYAHVANKDELLDLILERVLGDVVVPLGKGSWRERISLLAQEIRRVLTAHADIARVAMVGGPTGPNGLALGEAYLAILREAGFPDRVCSWALDRVSLYVTADVAERALFRPRGDAERYWQQVGSYFRSLPPQQFPHTVAMVDELMVGDADERFEFGLELLLDGLVRHHPDGS